MNQASWIVVFIVIGFFVYITMKGQLPQFQAAIFNGAQTTAPTTSTAQPAAASPAQTG